MPGPRGPKNRAPDPNEMANCRPFLDEQIDIIQPRVIMALGAPAAKSFLGRDFQITKMRGRWYDGPAGIPLMVTFHPAYVLRQTGGELTAVKRLVWADLKAVRAKLDEPRRWCRNSRPEQASASSDSNGALWTEILRRFGSTMQRAAPALPMRMTSRAHSI